MTGIALSVVVGVYTLRGTLRAFTPLAAEPTATMDAWALVVDVPAGDRATVQLDDGTFATVRYLGLRTPQPETDTGSFVVMECYGAKARVRNQELVLGQRVWLEQDVSDTDADGYLLRYVYRADGAMVNTMLLTEGYARATPMTADMRFTALFESLERQARQQERGLWGACELR